MSSSRQYHLDSMRGLAALIVIILHFFTVFYPYTSFGQQSGYTQHFSWENIFHYFPFNILISGRFAVCLFFILSGYVLSYSLLGEKNNKIKIFSSIIKRPIRLGGLVISTIIIAAILWSNGLLFHMEVSKLTNSIPYFSTLWPAPFNLQYFIEVVLFSPFKDGTIYNPPLWTISIELYGSIMVFLLVFVTGSFKYRLLVYIALFYMLRDSLYQGFIIGILFADLDKNYKQLYAHKVNSINMSGLLMVGLIYASTPVFFSKELFSQSLYSKIPEFYFIGGTYAMNGAAIVFFSINLLNPAKKILNKPAFRFLGDISYSLYVTHFLVIGSFASWLFLLLIQHMTYLSASLMSILISLPIIITISYIMTKYIDKPSVLAASKINRVIIQTFEKFNTNRNTTKTNND